MDTVVVTYAVYLTVSVALTVWVARTLFRSGGEFLVDVFAGRKDLAQATNHLLVVGFYLVNLGYVALALRVSGPIADTRGSIETLSTKVGGVLLVLGLFHFANLFVLSRIRRRGQLDVRSRPPVAPTGQHPAGQQGPFGAPSGPVWQAPAAPAPQG